MATSIHADWVQKATLLKTGEELFVQVETKDEQRVFHSKVKLELRKLREIDPVEASTLVAGITFRDARHWVFIRRAAANPLIGFLKTPDGRISRISIEKNEEVIRRYKLMIEDGWTREQIEEDEGIQFTEEEVNSLWPEVRNPSIAMKESTERREGKLS